jgi:hypothetical protein
MPREIVKIEINASVPTCESGAKFFSVLAYPDQRDNKERQNFRVALCRWAIRAMAIADKAWATQPQPIRPEYFLLDEKRADSTLRRGIKLLHKRFAATHYVVMPRFNQIVTGHLETFDGFNPTVENMLNVMMSDMGWKPDSLPTAKTKIWKPTRPVVHAVAAVTMCGQRLGIDLERYPLGKHCHMPIEAFLLYPDPEMLRRLVEMSEIYRVERLPLITQFKIPEEDTIQFVVS